MAQAQALENMCLSMLGTSTQVLEPMSDVDDTQRNYMQWCGNSQSYRTLSDKSSECPVN